LFDDELRKLLDRETLFLVTYRMLSEIEPESILEFENTDETMAEVNHTRSRINEIELELQGLKDHFNLSREKEEILYTERFDIPPTLFSWWPVHKVTCPSHLRHIPISSWKDVVERGTQRTNVYYQGRSKFPVLEFQADLWSPCRGKVEFYAKSTDIPAMKAQLEREQRWHDILVQEHDNLVEQSKGKIQEVEERTADLFAIARAQEQVLSLMNKTRRAQLDEYEKLVILLWNPSISRPTEVRQVDDFLIGLREYRRFEEANRKPRPVTIGDISRLASYVRAWMERKDQ
jgi:hypothetical protein